MRTETLYIYKYEELNDCAKANARAWFRNSDSDNFWAECVIDDAKEVAALMGWKIDKVYYRGFWSQGDGACFEGIMRYNKRCAKLVKAHTNDEELNRIAKAWQDLQRRNFYALRASVKHRGHYQHEMCTEFECEDTRSNYGWMQNPEAEDDIKEIARDFMRWIYKRLEAEYEYSVSDEVVAENIIANGYEFTEDGEIH